MAKTTTLSPSECAEPVVYVEEDFAGRPDEDGVLATYRLELPPFERGVYYSAWQKHDPAGRKDDWWPAGANRTQGLAFTGFADLNPGGLFLLLRLEDGRFLAVLPMAGREAVSWFDPAEDELRLHLGTLGTAEVEGDLPVAAWAGAGDPYAACHRVWRAAVEHELVGGSTRLRRRKRYPEPFRYLGWCSWEEFRKDISAELLADAMEDIGRSDLPIRYVLVDDGWLRHEDGRLVGFQPNEAFPQGWEPLTSRRDPEGIRWMGLWMNFNGYWKCIRPQNELGPLNEHLMPVTARRGWEPATESAPALLPAESPIDSLAFYHSMIGTAREAGFDFVKVDDQASNLRHYRGTAWPVRCAATNGQSLEAACAHHVEGLINCMAHNVLCVFNTRNSAVSRCSEDYRVGDLTRARRHLQNSYANILWLGQTVWGDHDMFHSADPVSGRVMALSKALSGGPIYLSDNPRQFDEEAVRPLCLEDGELLRPLAPAAPLPDSIFMNPLTDGRPYRAVAPLANGAAAVAAYNLTEPEQPVRGAVRPADYAHAAGMMQPHPDDREPPEEGLLLYDWRRGSAERLESEYGFELPEYGDFFALLLPIEAGWAVVGRTDKFLSPAAVLVLYVDSDQVVLRVRESGPFALWRAEGQAVSEQWDFRPAGGGLWGADPPVGERDVTIRCRVT
ncbi:MAG: Sip1-related alpha-galactosidase [Planctomycetota bacterium]